MTKKSAIVSDEAIPTGATTTAADDVATDFVMPAPGQRAEYPLPAVSITIDGEDETPERQVRILSRAQVERRDALHRANAIEVANEVANEPHEAPLPPAEELPSVDTGASLLAAAQAVHDARTALTGIDSKLAELAQKSHKLETVKAAAKSARAMRAKLLADAMLAGKKADLSEVDKQCEATARALEKREDEITAVEHATVTLSAQRAVAKTTLSELEMAYKGWRGQHLQSLSGASFLAEKFWNAITEARTSLAHMPTAHFHERLLSTGIDLAGADQLLSAAAVRAFVTSRAEADLAAADECAALLPPNAPTKFLGYVWKDGSVHDEPEPSAAPEVAALRPGIVSRTDSGANVA